MLRGLYTAATGMQMQSLERQTVADNLANLNTTGFKKAKNLYKSYADQVLSSNLEQKVIGDISKGVDASGTTYSFEQGPLKKTDNPFDLALNGEGFFPVQLPNGEIQFSRNGHFTVDRDGFLTTPDGAMVLDEGFAPVSFGTEPLRDLSVMRDGDITANGRFVTRLQAFKFPPGTQVTRTSRDRFDMPNKTLSMVEATGTSIQQGFLESSNVNSVQAATEMIQVMRSYEANQKVVRSAADTLQMLMDVGRI